MYFTRKRDTGDNINDIILGCQYLLFAWGGRISLKRKETIIHKHKFQEASEVEICLCFFPTATTSAPTANGTVMSKLPIRMASPTPTSAVITQPECLPQCSVASDNCQNNPKCMALWQQYHTACYLVNEWNGVGEPPLCTEECKEAADQLKSDRLGMLYACCFCDDEACRNGKDNLQNLCEFNSSHGSECTTIKSACRNATSKYCIVC